MRGIFFFFLMVSYIPCHAESYIINNSNELLRLPRYCWGTQQIREISQDPTPITTYVAKYGEGYNHLHHYCWSLNQEYKAAFMRDRALARSELVSAIGGIDYVLRNNHDPKFFFLPEIYASKARILFQLDQPSDAVTWLRKAIELNPGYVSAYARLSDYYVYQGDETYAIKILKEGISKCHQSDTLKRRLKELESNNTKHVETPHPHQ